MSKAPREMSKREQSTRFERVVDPMLRTKLKPHGRPTSRAEGLSSERFALLPLSGAKSTNKRNIHQVFNYRFCRNSAQSRTSNE